MAYSAPSTRSTSDLITAAIWNADLVANEIAIYAGALSVTSQAIGDILYASSTTQFARVAAVAAGQVLGSAGTGTVPAYSATPALTSVDMGGTTVYGSRAITVDTGGVLNIVLASAAGDDFTVDTSKLVVSGDSGHVGINTATPGGFLDVNGLVVFSGNTAGKNTFEFSTHASDEGRLRIKNVDTDTVQIRAGGDSYFNGGSVGIGTAAPISLLDVRGPVGTGATPAGLLTLATNELTIVDGDQLGRLEFRSPIATAGTDAIVSAAAIWVEANATFSASVNAADIVFATAASGAATEKMRILSSGNVGIGTSTPGINFGGGTADYTSGPTLEINGGTRGALLISGTTDAQLLFGDAGNSADEQKAGIGYDSGILSLYHVTDANYGRSAPGLSLLNSGSVGIGTAAPSYPLHVKAVAGYIAVESSTGTNPTYFRAVNTSGSAFFGLESNTGGNVAIGSNPYAGVMTHAGAYPLQFGTNNTVRMTISSAGYVGIGVAAPARHLHVHDANATWSVVQITNNGSGTALTDGFQLQQVNAHSYVYNYEAGNIHFGTSAIERMSIAAAGAVNVNGAFSKGSGSFKIDHPLPALNETHNLIHSFIEGPQADLIYRGRADLVDGSATVDLDVAAGMTVGTWVLLCRDEQVFTTNETSYNHVRGTVSGSTLTIECEEATCTDSVSWMVVAERQDQHMRDSNTEWTDENGRPIIEPLKTSSPAAAGAPSA